MEDRSTCLIQHCMFILWECVDLYVHENSPAIDHSEKSIPNDKNLQTQAELCMKVRSHQLKRMTVLYMYNVGVQVSLSTKEVLSKGNW